jgi:post-segregation antitoxin (ccd killing protein)
MTVVAYAEDAAFYRAAVLLGLIRGDEVIRWADGVLAEDSPPALFVEIATTPPDDLTLLRQRLFDAGGERESVEIVRRLIGLVHGDLASGRRSFADTMTVIKQLRAFVTVDRDLNERLKTLGVDVFMAAPGTPARAEAEQRVRDWLRQHA